MIIRSQDEKNIVNLDNVYAIYRVVKSNGKIKENYETDIRCSNGLKETEGILGTYSAEEKAIKVLDMIQVAYEETSSLSGFGANTVFQMPQDSEV